jgi:hypothetical protein
MTVFCGATMVNLVLLAENRLTLPTENRVMPLRLGFLVQFLLIVTWAVRGVITGTGRPAGIAALEYIQFLGVIGGFHLAVVAMFTVTELGQPGAATSPLKGRWRAFNAILGPGTGPAALYVLAQMGVLLVTGVLLQNAAGSSSRSANWHPVQWLFVICGFIALYTGVPTLLLRTFPRMRPFQARVAVLLLVALAEVLPDLIYYVVSAADSPLAFSARHLLSPLRTLFNWETVLARGWQIVPEAMGAAGLLIYVVLIANGARPAARAEPVSLELRATESNTGDSRLD